MADDLRAKVVEGEGKNRRVLWIGLAILIPVLCCCGLVLSAWLSGDAVLEALGLLELLQP